MVESHSPQGEGPGQQTHMCEQNPDGGLELGQLLKDRRRFDQLPVGLRLLDLQNRQGYVVSGLAGHFQTEPSTL